MTGLSCEYVWWEDGGIMTKNLSSQQIGFSPCSCPKQESGVPTGSPAYSQPWANLHHQQHHQGHCNQDREQRTVRYHKDKASFKWTLTPFDNFCRQLQQLELRQR